MSVEVQVELSARDKLEQKFKGQNPRLGGKGTMKRKNKKQSKSSGVEDKKCKELVKKLNAQPLPEISEMNFFTKDQKIIQFKNPDIFGNIQEKIFIVHGSPVERSLADSFGEMVNQLTPEQIEKIKESLPSGEAKKEEKPELVNFEEASKK